MTSAPSATICRLSLLLQVIALFDEAANLVSPVSLPFRRASLAKTRSSRFVAEQRHVGQSKTTEVQRCLLALRKVGIILDEQNLQKLVKNWVANFYGELISEAAYMRWFRNG